MIVDVMPCSTCVSLAVSNGAYVYPWPGKDASAIGYANTMGANVASSERVSHAGGFRLSPVLIQQTEHDEKLLLSSPNGSATSCLARDVDAGVTVFSSGFRNLTLTARVCRNVERSLVVPWGERGADGALRPAIEKGAASGGVIAAIGHGRCSPDAEIAVAVWQQRNLLSLRECTSALELQQRGAQADVVLCLNLDSAKHLCRLQGDFYTSGTDVSLPARF